MTVAAMGGSASSNAPDTRTNEQLIRQLHVVVKNIDGPDHSQEHKCTNVGGNKCCQHVYHQKTQDAIKQTDLPKTLLDTVQWTYEVEYAQRNIYAAAPEHEMSLYCITKFRTPRAERTTWYEVNYVQAEQAVRVLCLAPDFEVSITKAKDPVTGQLLHFKGTGICVPAKKKREAPQSSSKLVASPMRSNTVLLESIPMTSNLMVCTNVF